MFEKIGPCGHCPNDDPTHTLYEWDLYLILIAIIKKALSWRNWEDGLPSSVWHLVRAVLFKEAESNSDLEIGTQLSRRIGWSRGQEGQGGPPNPLTNVQVKEMIEKNIGPDMQSAANAGWVPFLQNNVPKPKVFTFFKIKPYWSPHHLLTLCFLINSESHI